MFKARGEITVKGKGTMKTYFLIGHVDRTRPQPNDEFSELPEVADALYNTSHPSMVNTERVDR
jgi:hypothetical protein